MHSCATVLCVALLLDELCVLLKALHDSALVKTLGHAVAVQLCPVEEDLWIISDHALDAEAIEHFERGQSIDCPGDSRHAKLMRF